MTVNIDVVYCANYNDCTVEINGVPNDVCANAVIDIMYDSCDEDGYCEADDDTITAQLTTIINATHGGNDAVVNVRVDRTSS